VGKPRRGLEGWKVLIETDTAAVLDAVHAVEDVRLLWYDVSGRRPTSADTEALAGHLQRVDLGLGVIGRWMALLRRLAPAIFRIVGTNDNTDS